MGFEPISSEHESDELPDYSILRYKKRAVLHYSAYLFLYTLPSCHLRTKQGLPHVILSNTPNKISRILPRRRYKVQTPYHSTSSQVVPPPDVVLLRLSHFNELEADATIASLFGNLGCLV